MTAAIRTQLTANGRLSDERPFEVWKDLGWTAAERSDPARYTAGLWVRATQNMRDITRGTRLHVIGHDAGGHVIACDTAGLRHSLPLRNADHFKVYQPLTKAFAVGDVIRITENGQTPAGQKFVNGAIHRIAGFDAAGDIKLDTGKTLPRDFGCFDYGYATTSVSAQGRTVDTVLVAMSTASLPATFDQQFYVTVSRGKSACHIYSDDLYVVREAVTRSGQRGSATELVEGQLVRGLRPAPITRAAAVQHETDRSPRDHAFLQRAHLTANRMARAHAQDLALEAVARRDTSQLTHAEHRGVIAREAAHALDAR